MIISKYNALNNPGACKSTDEPYPVKNRIIIRPKKVGKKEMQQKQKLRKYD